MFPVVAMNCICGQKKATVWRESKQWRESTQWQEQAAAAHHDSPDARRLAIPSSGQTPHTAMSPSRLATSAVARPGPRLPTTPKRTKPFSCNSSRGPAPHIACSVGPLLSATAPSPTICREKNRVTHSFVLFETLPRCVPRLACEASQRVVQLAPLRSVLCCRRSRCRPSTSIPSASANSTTRNPRCALYVRRASPK